jgi:S1-C subfamily serine protease
VLVVGVLVAIGLRTTSRPTTSPEEVDQRVDEKVAEAIADLQEQPPRSIEIYGAIGPAMVVVNAGDAAIGSGVVVNAQGDILTSLHVVDGAAGVSVTFWDGTKSPARVRSSDPEHDIAVLTPAQLPGVVVPAVLGGGAQIGDEAYVVGHPLGLVGSLTTGVISGLDRSFPLDNGKTLHSMIQFDAAVNPGNSGGPLLNRNGQVIGIVTGLANTGGDNQFTGIGFAVPIGTAGGAAGAPAK